MFLSYLISDNGVSMSEDAIDTILKWDIVQSIKDMQYQGGAKMGF